MGANPVGISVSPDGSKVYVANYGSNTVNVIYTAADTVADTIIVGSAPQSLGNFISTYTLPLGIASQSDITETVSIYPNPCTAETTITFSEEQKNTIIKVINILGEEVQQLTTSNKQLTLDLSGAGKGIYFAEIINEKRNIVNKKIAVQ